MSDSREDTHRPINKTAKVVIYILVGLIVAAVGLVSLGLVFRDGLTRLAMSPGEGFEAYEPPPAPDYADEEAWAALPWRRDSADLQPESAGAGPGAPVDLGPKPADVFFVHPTTYLGKSGWNAAIGQEAAEPMLQGVMKHQASVFATCCRVFAPRYRQATFYYSIAQNEDSWKAVDLAYGDVRAAFRHFVENWKGDRPFILAAHSQGSRHALRLLEEEIAGTPLARNMVAAYVVGLGIPETKLAALPGISVCDGAEDTGCLAGWTTIAAGGKDARYRTQKIRMNNGYTANADAERVCVNPLHWGANETAARRNLNLGAVDFTEGDAHGPLKVGLTGAQCRDGTLWIERPREGFTRMVLEGSDYHVFDYNLFYENIRRNAAARVAAFEARQSES